VEDRALDAGLAEIAARVGRREVSAEALVDAALTRIARLDPQLDAFCTLTGDRARRDAAALDRRIASGSRAGPLAGVPVAIKDLVCTRGVRTTFGSRLYADHVPEEDDVVVERLQAAGAIVVGKTNTSEFGYGPFGHNELFPPTRNPWNRELTSGGSSAGSAAAVAAAMVPLAIGSDGGGSIRIPAALCGVFGIKPSWGRVPVYPGCRDERYPGASGWESLEHIGPLTRTAADAALALSVLVGPTARDRHSIPAEIADWSMARVQTLHGKRIALSLDLGFAKVDPEIRAAVAAAAQALETKLGCVVEAVDPPLGDLQPIFEALVALDTDREGLQALGARSAHTFAGPLSRLLQHRWTADEFTRAILARKRVVNSMWRFMQRFEFVLMPATAAVAFPLGLEGPQRIDRDSVDPTAWTPFSSFANLTGQPAACVPVGYTASGLPIGMQIVGRHLDDPGVLSIACAVETLVSVLGRRPQVDGRAGLQVP
jgi:aspartyl-tRNA(Asn)/glutamyl-tRNA(Gln) amidotransferase subunit A